MRAAVFAYTRRGARTAERLVCALAGEEVRAFAVERFMPPGFERLGTEDADFYGRLFSWADAMLFVGACGIAVRSVAPWVRDKRTDPAVIAVDEAGRFVVPLLSGHIGGANALARRLARALDAVPVVTTATDINGRFSADAWAAENGCAIGGMDAARAVSAAILESDVPLCSDFPIVPPLPAGAVHGRSGALGIYITCGTDEPFETTLRLIPPVLHVGIGCRRGTAAADIRAAVDAVLGENALDPRAVKRVCSIDLKADEPGLLAFCAENGWPARFYPAAELARLEGSFTASDFVRETTGVDNICERAAIMGAARLIVKKTARRGVTAAVAAEDWEVRFG